jgi:hypothetical protein
MTPDDLARLASIASDDREARFARRPRWRPYADRVLCVALCQGAAQHYVDGRNGVKDFDVYTFYAEHPTGPFPYRWMTHADFGRSRFGRYPGDPDSFRGRRVDLIGRSLEVPPSADPVEALRRYLTAGRTETARKLARKAVVVLEPDDLRGEIIWPQARLEGPSTTAEEPISLARTPAAPADAGKTPLEQLRPGASAESSGSWPGTNSSSTSGARCPSATASEVVGTSTRDHPVQIGSRRPTTTRGSRCTGVISPPTTSGSRTSSATDVTTNGGQGSTRCSGGGCR